MNTYIIKLSQINVNTRNPRAITEAQLDRLVKSLLVFPEMQQLRPIVIDETYTALGGNMRYRALTAISQMSAAEVATKLDHCIGFVRKTEAERTKILGYWCEWLREPTAVIVQADQLTEAQKREFVIKDNVSFGDWDDAMLTEDFDPDELVDWGLGEDLELSPDDCSEEFSLPDGDKGNGAHMAFSFTSEQAAVVRRSIAQVGKEWEKEDNFGNTNKNANALYYIVRQWEEQRK